MKHLDAVYCGWLIFIGMVVLLVTGCFYGTPLCWGSMQRKGPLETVPAMPMPDRWQHFQVLIWPYQTDIRTDLPLYRKLGLGGFQIDRGFGKHDQVNLANAEQFPYYVGHAADKGILYLTGDNIKKVTGRRALVQRPFSLADPKVVELLKNHLRRNIADTRSGPVLAYAFDDEISLGRFTNPADVDISESSLAWFQEWLQDRYGSIGFLNKEWGVHYDRFAEVRPLGFEMVRKQVVGKPLSRWNLSRWQDFRSFMDFQFAAVLAELTCEANRLDPDTPAGFVGAQAPAPWGGYDYALLTRAAQWMEAYDIFATNEILRSWWNADRRPRMQTFFSSGNPKQDSWFFWYYYLHGNQGIICWPEGWFVKNEQGQKTIVPHIQALEKTFRELQGPVGKILSDPAAVFDADPIGIYYSHPSIQASWVMDALAHGKTWPRRFSSIDNNNQSAGLLRNVWCKTLEDLGYQYDFVSYLDVIEGRTDLGRFRVIILPRTICLSDIEASALRKFVRDGGTIVADYLCGIMDSHGRGREKGGSLDDLFGVFRNDLAGYLDGKGAVEIDGELWVQPFEKRFPGYRKASHYNGLPVFERGLGRLKAVQNAPAGLLNMSGTLPEPGCLVENRFGKGGTVYLNLTPLLYRSPKHRHGDFGQFWRQVVARILVSAGMCPRVSISVADKINAFGMLEALWWKKGDKPYLGIIKNSTLQQESDQGKEKGKIDYGVTGPATVLQLCFPEAVHLVNMRTGKDMGGGTVFRDDFRPWEGNLYEVKVSDTRLPGGVGE